MKNIETLIANSRDEPDDVDFPRQENQQRELGYCEPAGTDTDSLAMLITRDILVDEFESKDEG
jgi:hypothetical protein